MSFDDRIKRELEGEAEQIDEILNDKQGMFELVAGAFKNGLGIWVTIVNVIIFIVTGLILWSGYEFFVGVDLDTRVFWGVCFVITVSIQVALKQWVWMEMNRGSLLRELKRLEVAVVRLNSKIEGVES